MSLSETPDVSAAAGAGAGEPSASSGPPDGARRGAPLVVARAPVVEVTLLEDRARVVRRGVVTLPAGQVRIRIDGVAPVLADKSLVARIAGAEVAFVRCVRALVPFAPLSEQPDGEAAAADPAAAAEEPDDDGTAAAASARPRAGAIGALRARRRRLAASLAELATAQALAQRELATLDRLVQVTLAEAAEDAAWGRPPADLAVRLDALHGRERRARAQHLEVSEALAEAQRQDARLAARIAEVEDGAAEEVAHVVVDGVAATAGDAELTVAYLVPNALWRPYHEARLDGDRVTVTTDACVWQRTGEDWTDARLGFSTERASLGTEPPALASDLLAVQRRAEAVQVEVREQAIETTGLGAARVAAELPGIDDGGAALRLEAPAPATVRSDGRPHRVRLDGTTVDAAVDLVAIPELAPLVLLRSTQTHRGAAPLLAGPVDLVRDGGLVGRTQTLFVAPGERFELGWGPEPELRVAREVTVSEAERGVLTSWITATHTVELRLSNLGPRPRRVKVRERVPVSEVEKVRIEVEAPRRGEPPHTRDEDGIVEWTVEIPPRGKQALRLRYTVARHDSVSGL